jgi:hypothetical protein
MDSLQETLKWMDTNYWKLKIEKHSDDILGARMLWKPKEARI